MTQIPDDAFRKRQEAAKAEINRIDREDHATNPRRDAFFETVYDQASGDAARVPWADLQAKPQLLDWLSAHPGAGREAVDIGCGLGDNAEAIARHGWQTLGFDFSPKAIDWARARFPQSPVTYETGDLFNLRPEWLGRYDLVHECFTLQSIPPDTLAQTIPATCALVAPGGALLVYTRLRPDGAAVDGPPWPLERSVANRFADHGMVLEAEHPFVIEKGERVIDHLFAVWRKKP